MDEKDPASLRAIELGRALAELGQMSDAAAAFALALDDPAAVPEERLEAAAGVLQCGGDYHAAYDALLDLYGGADVPQEDGGAVGSFAQDGAAVPESSPVQDGGTVPPEVAETALNILREAFYLPNEDELRNRYRENRALLSRYPYLFRRDFPAFDALSLQFFPYDDGVYCPFDGRRFLPRTQPGYEVISRNFFRDLEKPILAEDVFSQYELAYLRDNVRRSEDIGRENHVYLHYTDWETFCAWLQVLDFRPLLKQEKLVFLIGDELSRYPIDFAAEYGIDYSRFPLKPVSVREVTRLIWHTQLSSHNGGDFFNEIFDAHPNLICVPTIMYQDVLDAVGMVRDLIRKCGSPAAARHSFRHWEDPSLAEELYRLKRPTDKDCLAALYLGQKEWNQFRDRASRIAPALFFQPHFPHIAHALKLQDGLDAELYSREAENLRSSPLFRDFPYIKTFSPLRRPTTSFGGAMRFVTGLGRTEAEKQGIYDACPDAIILRVLNRSFLADPSDRRFRDAVVVRLEDGKLNPRAALSRLAAFLDLPWTPSMEYCSERGERDPRVAEDPLYAAGFSLASLNRDYSRYVNHDEAAFIEYCLRDAYQFYGYDFQYWDGVPLDGASMSALIDGFTTQDRLLREDWDALAGHPVTLPLDGKPVTVPADAPPEERERVWTAHLEEYHRNRQTIGKALLLPLRFVSRDGVPLRTIPLLEPDPDLLENPVYH